MKKVFVLLLVSLPFVGSAAPHDHGHGGGEGETLHEIMHELGEQMLALTDGLLHDDADAVVHSAAAIADHAPISQDELERIRHVLGDEMAGFEALDKASHAAAVRVHEAAKAGRTDDVITRLGDLQRTCVGCHTQYRERLEEDH